MAAKRPRTHDSVASNLRRLLALRDWSQVKLSHESGISQTHISAILRGESSATVEVAAALAKPFGLNGWHLLIPNLPDELLTSPSLSNLLNAYIDANQAGRDFLDAAAQREIKRK
jgi:transcriptional regulator with XRE-family HTH domain